MNKSLMFSSTRDDWQTPPELFAALNYEFGGFGLDVAAHGTNAMTPDYLGPDRDDERFRDALGISWRDALDFTWGEWHRPCWLNPPYGKGLQGKFIAKAASERLKGVTTVMLIPARTDTKAWHNHIWDNQLHQPREGVEIRFLPGRVKFVGAAHGAPFPSAIVVFRGQQ